MHPGENCLDCHSSGDVVFSAAGTVFDGSGNGVSGVTVSITDGTSTTRTTTTNEVGNFYFRDPLTPPLHPTLTMGTDTVSMSNGAPNGACNTCHGAGGTPGPLHFP